MDGWTLVPALKKLLGLRTGHPPCEVRLFRQDGSSIAALRLEIADTVRRRARGLMGRAELEADGMLFVYPWPRTARIWMAGTLIPLDAVFVDRTHTIVSIAADLQPHSRKWVSSGRPVKWVLEIRAGRAAALGLKPGDRVEFDC